MPTTKMDASSSRKRKTRSKVKSCSTRSLATVRTSPPRMPFSSASAWALPRRYAGSPACPARLNIPSAAAGRVDGAAAPAVAAEDKRYRATTNVRRIMTASTGSECEPCEHATLTQHCPGRTPAARRLPRSPHHLERPLRRQPPRLGQERHDDQHEEAERDR